MQTNRHGGAPGHPLEPSELERDLRLVVPAQRADLGEQRRAGPDRATDPVAHRRREPGRHRDRAIRSRQGPPARGHQVLLVVEGGAGGPRERVGGQAGERPAVAQDGRVARFGRQQRLRVVPDDGRHLEPVEARIDPQEARVDELGQERRASTARPRPATGPPPPPRARSRRRTPSAPRARSGPGRQELERHVERRAQALMAGGTVARAAGEQLEAVDEALPDRSTESTRVRAAASSTASGRPSSAATISRTTPRSSTAGSTGARSRNSSIPASSGSGGTSTRRSPVIRSARRVVTRNVASGASRSQDPSVAVTVSTACSRLSSSTSVRPRAAIACPSWTTGSVRLSAKGQPVGDGGAEIGGRAAVAGVDEPAPAGQIVLQPPGDLGGEPGLAEPAGAHQADQPIPGVDALDHRAELGVPSEEPVPGPRDRAVRDRRSAGRGGADHRVGAAIARGHGLRGQRAEQRP